MSCQTVPPEPTLDERIDAIIATAGSDATVGVAYLDTATGATLFRNERVLFHAASTMKVPVMLAIFEAIDRGELRLDQPIPVRNDFVSILDGSQYSMLAEEDSDPELYELTGSEAPIENLMRRMIVRSSNLATNLLIERVGADRVMTLMRSLGAGDSRILRGVQDIRAYEAGMNNMVTARDLMLVLRSLEARNAVSSSASGRMLEILHAQEFNEGIPAGVPEGVRVAHKTGSITAHYHDAGIVYPPEGEPYILVVLTRNVPGDGAEQVVAGISRAVWQSR
ncbi:MAG TPA: serine hydrolase [Thermoanaerobaculia bacterium]|nr:serine hydrolase [Thermoanaerobaculia bacterium]